jgi:hypothetical protein
MILDARVSLNRSDYVEEGGREIRKVAQTHPGDA